MCVLDVIIYHSERGERQAGSMVRSRLLAEFSINLNSMKNKSLQPESVYVNDRKSKVLKRCQKGSDGNKSPFDLMAGKQLNDIFK